MKARVTGQGLGQITHELPQQPKYFRETRQQNLLSSPDLRITAGCVIGRTRSISVPTSILKGMGRQGKSSSPLQVCLLRRTCLGHNADGEAPAALAALAVPAQAGAGAFHLGPTQWRLGEDR